MDFEFLTKFNYFVVSTHLTINQKYLKHSYNVNFRNFENFTFFCGFCVTKFGILSIKPYNLIQACVLLLDS